MIELPEASTIARQLNETIIGKRIVNVTAAQHPHKFAWYYGDPRAYHELLHGKVIGKAARYGSFIEIEADNTRVLLAEGVNVTFFHEGDKLPARHQLHIEFEDHSSIVGSVQMYGGLWAFPSGEYVNPYYLTAKEKPDPFSEGFDEAYFDNIMSQSAKSLSLKAFLATEQRIPGFGNGVLQDILFNAKLHPKKRLNTLTDPDIHILYHSIKTTLAGMDANGGRDTERDLILSKNTSGKPCGK